jgi:probable HAF family extracellular repeat protein
MEHIAPMQGYDSSAGRAINNAGQAVITCSSPEETRAFLYRRGKMTDLGSLGGFDTVPNAIDEKGQIVGHSKVTTTGGQPTAERRYLNPFQERRRDKRAFLYDAGRMIDLNAVVSAPGWILAEANDINNKGQIVGTGYYKGESRAFLLTPVKQPR